ncbi:MAG: four helix bundle protein, partial [Bacteroidales bacterium]|nr:four helix bundle protein [Bacteroidales bacterium]
MSNILKDKSFKFSIRIVKLAQLLNSEKKEYVLSKQILRSGTSIGAMVREGEYAESKADFIHKLTIALKEANETQYWLDVLYETQYLKKDLYESLILDIEELL